jgi:acetoin utilization deacetylase AcuC-like enzyme
MSIIVKPYPEKFSRDAIVVDAGTDAANRP